MYLSLTAISTIAKSDHRHLHSCCFDLLPVYVMLEFRYINTGFTKCFSVLVVVIVELTVIYIKIFFPVVFISGYICADLIVFTVWIITDKHIGHIQIFYIIILNSSLYILICIKGYRLVKYYRTVQWSSKSFIFYTVN